MTWRQEQPAHSPTSSLGWWWSITNVLVAEAIPPIPAKLVERIRGWCYVDLADLLSGVAHKQEDSLSLSEDRIILVQSVDQVRKKRTLLHGLRHMLSWWQSWYQRRPPLRKRQQAYWLTCRWSSSCAKTWVVQMAPV